MKKQNNEDEQPQKVVTRYEQKMEKRKMAASKSARNNRIFNMACIVAGIMIAAAVVIGVSMSVINKNKATKDVYITVGSHEITKLEYDYYYNMIKNSYSSYLSYMGQDYESQPYSDTMSWKDAFDEMAVSQLTRTKALADDAAAAGFTADVTEEYNSFNKNLAQTAKSQGYSVAKYYKLSFGRYAGKSNLASYIKENLLAEAYYDHLLEQNTPSDEEIDNYYEENKKDYDKVSYKSFIFTADPADDIAEGQTDEPMQQIREQAEEMQGRLKAGGDFKELCLEYAAESDKATYQDAETDASLTESAAYSSIPLVFQDWLYDESRTAGDVTVAADEANRQYYVVEFVERIYDETTKDTISTTLAEERTTEYITALTDSYEVIDLSGELVYLTIPSTEESTEGEETQAAEETESAVETEASAETEPAGETKAAEEAEASAETEAAGETESAAETESSDETEAETKQ